MASLLQITDAHKSYGDQILLDGAEATISDSTKVGFVGRNGAGKSTLLRILLGEEELDKGEVVRHPSLRLGYLRQHDPFLPGETALGFLMRDSERPDWKCGEVAGRFELKGDRLAGPVAQLSGGWQTRVKLAALLLHEPNLLLLDEPTNFLDLRTQILLEHFLQTFRAGCLIVSHDRAFLRATCTHTLDLSRGKLTSFPGKIDAYLEFEAERRVHDERSNAAVMVKRKHLEDFIARNKARASTAALAQSKAKQLEKLEVTTIASYEPTARIRAPRIEPGRGRPSGARIWTSGTTAGRSPRGSTWNSNTAPGWPSSATTGRAKPPCCGTWSGRSSRSPAKSGGGSGARPGVRPARLHRTRRDTNRHRLLTQ